jgi:hypothetical protein
VKSYCRYSDRDHHLPEQQSSSRMYFQAPFHLPPRIDFDRTFNTTLAPCIATKHRSQTTADLSFVDGLSFPFAFPSRGGSYRRLRGFFGIWDATDVASRDLDLIILVMDLGTCQESEVNDGSLRPSQGYAGKKERGTAFLPRTSISLMSFVVLSMRDDWEF